jgi:hypothetical protein
MTATKYALVPVVATEQQIEAAWSVPAALTSQVYAAMLAAAPKELPEEVVDAAASALFAQVCGRESWGEAGDGVQLAFRSLARAALLAVMCIK